MSGRFERLVVSLSAGALVAYGVGPETLDLVSSLKFGALVVGVAFGFYALELAVANGLLEHEERHQREDRESRIRAASDHRHRR